MKKTMSSKERVLTTFARQEPDRVPVNYFSNPGIDQRLKKHFKLAENDDEGLRQVLKIDFRSVGAGYTGPKLHETKPGVIADEWGKRRRWVEHESGGYWDFCEWPLQHATLEEVENWPLPSPDDYDYASVAERCKQYGKYCVVAGGAGCGDIINSTSMLRNMEQVLIDLLTDDPAGLRLIDRTQETLLEIMTRVMQTANGLFDVFWIGEDLGTQRGPIIGLDLFRKHIRPRLQKFVDLAKAWNLPVVAHSCGSSSWAFNDFIEMGINVVDTLQPEAKDMSPAYLKRTYGDRLAFHGAISTAGVIASGTPADVVRDVRQTLEIMMPGGGYALSPTHALQDNSATENVVAMYEAAQELGRY